MGKNKGPKTTVDFSNLPKEATPGTLPNFNTILSTDQIINMCKQITILPDEKIIEQLKFHYTNILDQLNNTNDQILAKIFTDPDFLERFNKAIYAVQNMQYKYSIICNKIAYNYLTQPIQQQNQKTKQLLMQLTNHINHNIIIRLKEFIAEDLAIYLTIARFSTTKDILSASRVNVIIGNQDPDFMTNQLIANIYSILFNRFIPLFESTMINPQLPIEENPNSIEMYSRIGLVIVAMLEQMNINDISIVLTQYSGDWLFKNKPRVRFPMMAISVDDHPRIWTVLNALYINGTVVP